MSRLKPSRELITAKRRRLKRRTRARSRRLLIESFEPRRLLAGFIVNSNLDNEIFGDNLTTLREAIVLANTNFEADTITFDPTVFDGGANSLIRLGGAELEITDTLTIDASTATGVTITGDINGNDTLVLDSFITDIGTSLSDNGMSLDDNVRVLNFTASSGDLTLNNLTITGGRADNNSPGGDDGGGIRFGGSGLSGTLTIDQSIVSGNQSAAFGGGIFTNSGSVNLTSSTVSGNQSGSYGGGIASSSGSVSLASSSVSENDSGFDGGGIRTFAGPVSLVNSTVSGNQSGGDGGGIRTFAGPVSLTNSTVSENESSIYGGGISTFSGSVSLTSSTVSSNQSGDTGGGIRTNSAAVSLTSSTVSGNEAAGAGGGVFVDNALLGGNQPLTIENSIIAGNLQNAIGPGVGAPNDVVPDPNSILTINYSLIGVTDGLFITGNTNNLTGTAISPLDPLLGPLANNGGLTPTHALLATSPALNVGNNTIAGTDQRGAPFSRDDGNGVDIGSYERQTLPADLFVVTTATDELDFSTTDTSLREAINFANGSIGADTITFDPAVFDGAGSNSLIRLGGTELEITDTLTIDASTATDVAITGDTDGNDFLVPGTFITDIGASLSSSATSLDDNVRVLNFTGTSGGLTLNDLTITGGRADNDSPNGARGGGIRTDSGSVSLTSSTVSGNESGLSGGGIFTGSGSVSLTNSTVSGNESTFSGGGIFAAVGSVSLASSTVSGNGAAETGGGIRTNSGSVSLNSSTVSGNESGALGGGISTSTGFVSLTSSTVSVNESGFDGGGIAAPFGSMSLISSTVSGNEAGGAGGGVFVADTSTNPNFTITNSIIAGNLQNVTGPGVGAPNDLVVDPDSVLTINHNVIGVADNLGVITGNTGNLTGTATDPLDPLLGPLADNGGPTRTHALLPGSPAIDAGDNGLLPPDNLDQDGDNDTVEPIPLDQRGLGRVVDLPGVANATAGLDNAGLDIGAFELTDTTPPVVTSPANLNIEGNATGGATQESVFNAISAVLSVTDDLNPSPTITNDIPEFVPIDQTIDVIFAANDGFNEASATISVTIVDTTPPTIMGPSTATIEGDTTGGASSSGGGFAEVIAMLTASDIVDDDVVITSDTPTLLPLGDTVVTFTATDDSGNSALIMTTVTVTDAAPPMIMGPSTATIEGDTTGGASSSGGGFAEVIAMFTASDISDDDVVITSDAPALLPLGETVVIFTATDDAGNSASMLTTVTVTDATPPMIMSPSIVTNEGDTTGGAISSGGGFAEVIAMLIASDIVDDDLAITDDAPMLLPLGDTVVTFTATDDSGNSASTMTTITVVDTMAPVPTAAADISVEGDAVGGADPAGAALAAFLAGASGNDIVDDAVTITNDAPALFPIGETTVTFTAADDAGNTANTTATVTVTDVTAPTILAPADVSVEGDTAGGADPAGAALAAFLAGAVGSDIVDDAVTITNDAPALFQVGETTVTFTAADDAGNTATATATVTVTDVTAPTIMAPADVSVEGDTASGADPAGTALAAFLAGAVGSDFVDDTVTITNDAPALFPVGETVVTFTGADDAGNTATATATVTVIDATAPMITAPADVSVEGDTVGGADPSGAALAAFLAGAVGSDIVDDTITNDAPALFPVGETIVTFTATDDAGNTATADATVTVTDTIGPMLTVPNDSTIEGDIVGGASSTGTAFLAFEAMAPATDIVDGTVTVTHDAPAVLPVGATEVTFTATDAAGNTSTATATVTVEFVSDFGDAPAAADSGFANDYPVTRAQDGARHIVGDLFLGSFVDAEGDGQPDAQAGSSGGDDGNGVADEDGVVQVAQLISTVDDATVSSFLITASGTGRVDAWIDFNRDGDWDDANEQIATSVEVNAGSNLLSFAIPAGANIGDTAARFRLSSSGGLLPTGPAADGEVEDYWLSILDGNASPDVTVNDPEAIASLVLEDNQVVVRGSSEILFSVPLESVGVLNVDGQSDDDTITLDFSGGSVILEGGLNLDGAVGDNTLVLAGGDSDFSFAEATFQASNFSLIDLGDENANVITVDAASVSALSTAGPITIRGGDGDTIRFADSDDWRYDDPIEVDGRFTHQIANIVSDQVLQVDLANVWQNVTNPSDTNGDGNVTAGDALLVINELANNRFSDAETQELVDPTVQEWPGFFYDQNGDNRASALDALRIINFLDRQNLGEGEAESEAIVSSFLSATTSDAPASGLIDANATVVNEQPVLDAVFGSFAEASGVQQVSLSTPLSITQRSTSTSAVDDLLSDASFFDHLEAE